MLAVLFAGFASLAATAYAETSSLLASRHDFDVREMTRPGARDAGSSLVLPQANRFSMRQSYSLSALSGPGGSASSGLYLNTLSYRISAPLLMFVDVGFHTPLHSSIPGMSASAGAGSIVLPRMGLEYKPNDRLTMNLELVNGPDAWKAYGPFAPHHLPGSRTP